jgi:hypothetical protein
MSRTRKLLTFQATKTQKETTFKFGTSTTAETKDGQSSTSTKQDQLDRRDTTKISDSISIELSILDLECQ